MNALRNSVSAGLLATLAAITIPVASVDAQVTIVRINGGGTQPAASGSGNLATIFNAACDWWEATLVTSPYTLTLTYQWGPQSGGTLAAHTLTTQGGTPNRETAGSITFDNDGSSNWYLDPSPCDPSEYSTYTQNTGNYGGGSMIDEAVWTGGSGGASGNYDLFAVCIHEIGHSLGLSSANTSFQAERGDNDVDVTSPRPYAGSAIPLNSSSAHLAISTSLMWPYSYTSQRVLPSQADLVSNAQISQMTGIRFMDACSCARYIPDSDPASGGGNLIPFGTSGQSSLTTTFAQNNGGVVGGAVYFDLTSTSHLRVYGIDLNTTIGAGTEIYADVYYRNGTYAGHEGSMAGWSAWTVAKGTAAAQGSPSRLDLNRDLWVGSGPIWGIAIVARNFDHDYTNGSNVYSDANLTVTAGSASNVPFAGTITGRSVNARFRYHVDDSSWHNQIYQTVLRREDLGGAGSITGLAFAPTTTGRHYNRRLRVRMAHKPANYTLSTTFATNISGATTVLDRSYLAWHVRADTWEELPLAEPFAYNGTSDVVVEIFAQGNNTSTGTAGSFRSSSQERLFAYGFDYYSTPTTGTYSSSAGLKMRVEFECAETGEFGTSCGPVRADGYSTPVAGTSYWFDIHDQQPGGGAILVMGLTQTDSNLTTYGFTNCWAWNDNVASIFKVANVNGFATHRLLLPNTTAFNGLKIYGYWAALDSGQPGGLTFTNYVRMIIGSGGFSNPNN